MQIIQKENLENLQLQKDFWGSESDLYTCILNNKKYVYKELYINTNILNLYRELENVNEESLLIPKILVFKNRIIGHLTKELENYSLLFDLQESSFEEKIRMLKLIKEKIVIMHEYGIIHCDLHTANIMFKENDIKIIDFESCSYSDIKPSCFNSHSSNYLKENKLAPSVDIYNFNIDTASILYNVSWSDIFDYSYKFENRLTPLQKKVWVKTKERKELTSNDYLIDYY